MKERFFRWLAYRLPSRPVYWCAIRVMAEATTGPWSSQVVPDLRGMEALDRWEKASA